MSDDEDVADNILGQDGFEDRDERRERVDRKDDGEAELTGGVESAVNGNDAAPQNGMGLSDGNQELLDELNLQLDDVLLNELKNSSPESVKRALLRFKGTANIRNPSSYLSMLLRRYKGQILDKGFDELPGSVQEALTELLQNSKLSRSDIDDRVVGNLHNLSESSMLAAIKKYRAVDESDMQRPEGFFNSVVRRMINIEKQGSDGSPPQQVLDKIDQAVKEGHIKEGDLDSRCLDALCEFDADSGIAILDQLLSSNLTTVKNMGGYFLGIIKRYKLTPAEREREDRRRANSGYYGRPSDRRGGRPRGGRPPRDYYGQRRPAGGYRDSYRDDRYHHRDERDYGSYRDGPYADQYDNRDVYDPRGVYDHGAYDRGGYARGPYDRVYERPMYDRYLPQ